MSLTIIKQGSVWIIELHRSQRRNAINKDLATALFQAFTAFEQDKEAKIAVLWGAGGNFCSGADLKAIAEGNPNRLEPTGPGPLGPTRMTLSKPVIAAIEGYAVAGGLELAIWCDLRVASETAVFGVYCRRFGVPLIDGGTIRLPRLIGHGRAMDMILTGRSVAATEALQFGLVNRVVPVGESRKKAIEMANQIIAHPQMCMNADRQSAILQWGKPIEEALQQEFLGAMNTLRTESMDGARRFAKQKSDV